MRMPRPLGVVATAFLALGLGLGIGVAAVSNHLGSAGSGRSAANSIGSSQWDDPSPMPAQEHAGSALSLQRGGPGNDRWNAPEHHGDARISERLGRNGDEVDSDGSATRQPIHRPSRPPAEAQLMNASVPSGSGVGARPAHGTTSAPGGTSGRDGAVATPHPAPAGHAGNSASSGNGFCPKGAETDGTRETAPPQPSSTPMFMGAPVAAVRTLLVSLEVSRWNRMRPGATSSMGKWTSRHHHGRDVTGSEHSHASHGERHQDDAAGTHSPDLHGDHSARDAGPMQASPAGPDGE